MNIMLDLETLGTRSDSVILAIGAAKFNSSEVVDTFYEVIDLQSSIDHGFRIDANTVLWWMQQSDEARSKFKNPGTHITQALGLFQSWIDYKDIVWGNGADFDNTILATAYTKMSMKQPWNYLNNRCYRTIKNLYPRIELYFDGIRHCAVDDAINQAKHLIRILNIMNTGDY